MDLDEWEFLPDPGLIDYNEDVPQKRMFSNRRNFNNINTRRSVFDMDHFKCPSSSPRVTVPFQLEQSSTENETLIDELDKKGITKLQLEVNLEKIKPKVEPLLLSLEGEAAAVDQDTVSQVFFKKMKENEFVDMKQLLDSPKSNPVSRVLLPQIENFNFDDEKIKVEVSTDVKISELVMKNDKIDELEEQDSNGNKLDLWKMSLTGIGAICSFGVAAATICIIVFGSHHRNKHNQKLHFQFYTDDKRIKQVVHHATKLNEAISAARGLPMTRAHISFGGYYDAL